MNYGDIKRFDVANGIGVRVSLFVSGCTHHCKDCFSKETWDFHYYPDKDVWCYTGYLFDRDVLGDMCKKSEITKELLTYIDILVDGEFVAEQKNLKINFRGSDNQRIIDVKKSLETGEVVHWDGEKI